MRQQRWYRTESQQPAQDARERLHRLLRKEEPVADLAIDEALKDQLEDFDLPGGRLLIELLEGSRERG